MLIDEAITYFESVHKLFITIHDCAGIMWQYMSPERRFHRSPWCLAIKSGPKANARCMEFDIQHLRPLFQAGAEARYHLCPAGFVEWVAPLRQQNGQLIGVLFAGQRTADQAFLQELPLPPLQHPPTLLQPQPPPPVSRQEAELILEGVRQLVARIEQILWRENPSSRVGFRDLPRIVMIRNVVRRHCVRGVTLRQLADVLHLSESRTAHVVRELFGCSLSRLVLLERLRFAAFLLETTTLTVAEVARRCGIGDLSRFHRSFRAYTGLTPGKYRRQQDHFPARSPL